MRRTTWRRVGAVAAGAALVLGTGCYGKQLSSLEVRTARIEEKLTNLERMNRDFGTTVEALDRLIKEEIDQARAGRAGNQQRLEEIQKLMSVLGTRVDESGQQYRELKDVVKYSAAPRDSVGSGGSAGTVTPRALYDAAYQDLTRGNHGLAIMGFQEVINKFPDSELADNAQYWIGESYYAQKDYKQALQEFQKTADTYPQGDKLPAAMLKTALCQAQIGDKKSARTTLQKLIDRFPNSEEARLATTKLQEL